jgi:hypothetical protein
MNRWLTCVCVLASISVASTRQAATAADVAGELENVMKTNADGITHKDLEKAMSAIHSKSPGFVQTKEITERLLKDYNLKQRIVSFKFLGADKDYAVARVKTETVQDKGPAFKNNVVDSMQVFRKDSGKWKLWTSATLEIKYLDEAPATKAAKTSS